MPKTTNNEHHLQKIVNEINEILTKHKTEARDIPESLVAYAIIENRPYMIEEFIEDGFVAMGDSPFGWMKF